MPRFRTGDVADEDTRRCSFADLSLSPPLLRSLREMGCENPSPVQMRTIPIALEGTDVIVQAKSGTGKTIAFCSVLLHLVDPALPHCQGLVLTPTREIAQQVADELGRLCWYMTPKVNVACFIGGVPVEDDQQILAGDAPPHIVVGSPGRVEQLLKEKSLKTRLRCLVLDEADTLLDTGFRERVIHITEKVFSEDLQFVAVSATFPPPLVKAAEELFIHVEKKRSKGGAPPMRALPKHVFLCTSAIKKGPDGVALSIGDAAGAAGGGANEVDSAVLRGVLHFRKVVDGYHHKQKLPALLEVLTSTAYQQAFVFCKDASKTVQIAAMLTQAGVPAAASSGKMDQAWRTQAFVGLKRCTYRVMVCTDLMARGVDVEKVDVVVNLDLPWEKETYLHRTGRTARFGSIGYAVNLVFEGDEDDHLKYFQMQMGFELSDWNEREAAIAARIADLKSKDELEGDEDLSSKLSWPRLGGATSSTSPPAHSVDALAQTFSSASMRSWQRINEELAAHKISKAAALTNDLLKSSKGMKKRFNGKLGEPLTKAELIVQNRMQQAAENEEGDDEWAEEEHEEGEEEAYEEEEYDDEMYDEEEEEEEEEEEREDDAQENPGRLSDRPRQMGSKSQTSFPSPACGVSQVPLLPAPQSAPPSAASLEAPWSFMRGAARSSPPTPAFPLSTHAIPTAAALQVQGPLSLPTPLACQQPYASLAPPPGQWTVAAPPLLSTKTSLSFPPPPVLLGSASLDCTQVRKFAPPEWEPWMLHCASYAEYLTHGPGSGATLGSASAGPNPCQPNGGTAKERLEALWAHHCKVWT